VKPGGTTVSPFTGSNGVAARPSFVSAGAGGSGIGRGEVAAAPIKVCDTSALFGPNPGSAGDPRGSQGRSAAPAANRQRAAGGGRKGSGLTMAETRARQPQVSMEADKALAAVRQRAGMRQYS
jgi:hypothetical protein